MIIENKILKAVGTNKLNLKILGERKWYNYFISVNKLVWSRNLSDGYEIHVYSDEYKTLHLGTFKI
ncbi:hypothetical protein DMB65_07075 [Flavobacterium cheongpyeongense]|uniref:Uncharacterized protein n=1 Tax=Flavobacterium cheongpyeongense TaxID=2212651 RepID=A0A2V4BRW0_9FLAO|nr:hypothetical protein [Flavobacterium cheongpyeongense]PXY41701.1 hypothetical protein DMB65_07075 [Flavobacterium cheongpyeongense]